MNAKVPEQAIASCGDISCEFLVNPIPRPMLEPMKVHLKPEKPEVILMDNSKPNSMGILKRAQAELKKRGVKVRDEILIKKANAAVPVYGEQLEMLKQERGLILSGVND
jgi:hypothetical protein